MLYKMTKERIAPSDRVGVDTYDNPGGGVNQTRRETSSTGSKGSKAHADDGDLSEEESAVNEEEVLNGNALMVDQLWMWAVGPSKYQVSEPAIAVTALTMVQIPS